MNELPTPPVTKTDEKQAKPSRSNFQPESQKLLIEVFGKKMGGKMVEAGDQALEKKEAIIIQR